MGTSDCPLFPMESNSPPKPTSGFQDSPQELLVQPQEMKKDDHENVSLDSYPPTIKTSNNQVGDGDEEKEDEGSRTPTSSEQRIPLIPLSCPKAPKKPKPQPLSSAKRKADCRRRILLDLTTEVDSLFPPSILADLGGKMKKVRKLND